MTRKPMYGLIAADIAHVGVYLLEKSDLLLDVITLMERKHISAVVIEDIQDFSSYYIISHRDLIHFFAKRRKLFELQDNSGQGFELLKNIRASEIMRGPLEIIAKSTPIDEVVHLMNEKGYKRVIVGNNKDQPIGIISTKDIIAWTKEILPKGAPMVLAVIENVTGLILSKHVFKDEISEEYLDLLGGVLTAIEGITDEVMQNSGDLRFIEKDFYDIMLEQTENVTIILVCDESSIDLRIKLQIFTDRYMHQFKDDLELRKKMGYVQAIDKFKIRNLARIFD
ncbi:MAG: CBS domain-containing protein [Promethearchaeota archaeon]